MRRLLGAVLLALGFCALATAPLLRFYAADQIVAAPVDKRAKTVLKGDNARYFDQGKGKMVEGASLTSTNTIRGIVGQSTHDIAVWDSYTVLEDTGTGSPLQTRGWTVAFDRRNGKLRSCCTAAVDTDQSVKQSGLGLQWPLGSLSKKTYPVFDPATMRTWPAAFQGTQTVAGVKTYRYVQRVDPTVVEKLAQVPGQTLGLDPAKPHAAERVYSAENTFWIDPRSGRTVDQQQHFTTRLRSEGADRVTLIEADLRLTDAERKKNASSADDAAFQISMLRTTGPILLIVGGVVLLAAGVLLSRRGKSHGGHRSQAEPE